MYFALSRIERDRIHVDCCVYMVAVMKKQRFLVWLDGRVRSTEEKEKLAMSSQSDFQKTLQAMIKSYDLMIMQIQRDLSSGVARWMELTRSARHVTQLATFSVTPSVRMHIRRA